jgi:hypothetical protein
MMGRSYSQELTADRPDDATPELGALAAEERPGSGLRIDGIGHLPPHLANGASFRTLDLQYLTMPFLFK